MKIFFIISLAVICAGCAYEGKTLSEYFDNPREIIKDPHFESYKEQRDALESRYLNKEISYADYVQQMDDLDGQYAQEVDERNTILGQ